MAKPYFVQAIYKGHPGVKLKKPAESGFGHVRNFCNFRQRNGFMIILVGVVHHFFDAAAAIGVFFNLVKSRIA